jgi:crotonobetainyl-CoA:carnitine CoA-transferase CaiB-like acyl-CoA transferase
MNLLTGFRVVEIAHPLTEYAGLIMASLGADVFLVEPPEGASTRRRTPRVPDAGDSARGSMAFLARNMNKKSIVIEDEAALTELCNTANVVLDADRSCFHAQLANVATPVVVTITDEHRLGTSSIVGFAASGGMASSGWPDRPPCNAPSWLSLDGASIYAAVAAMIGTLAGGGRYEIPYEEAALCAVTPWTRTLVSYGMQSAGQGPQTLRLGDQGFPIYETADGHVRILLATPKSWQAFVGMLGDPEELTNGPWSDPMFRRDNSDALKILTNDLIRQHPTNELFLDGQSRGLTISPVYALDAFRNDPHVQGRELFAQVEDPEFGAMELLRAPFRLQGANDVEPRPAPAIGGSSAPPDEPQVTSPRPLSGIRVLQLSVGAVVPEAASLLALFGADVIKIESNVHVDFLRQSGLAGPLDVDNCPTFNQLNLGTRSVAVDLSCPEGVAIGRALAAQADVIMENMRGGVVERWGLDYESVRADNPDVVYLSSQGFGRGQYDGFQTFGPNLQTFSGITQQWAHADDPLSVGSTLNHPDHVAGKAALVPILAALAQRKGLFIEAAQFETAAALIADRHLEQFYADAPIAPRGNEDSDYAVHGCFPCAGDDAWIAIAAETGEQKSHLDELVGHDIRNWTRARQSEDAEAELRAAGIPASRLVTGDNVAADPSTLFAALPHPTADTRFYTGVPILDRSQGRPAAKRPPLLGEHTEAVLREVVGLDPEVIRDLAARRIVGH